MMAGRKNNILMVTADSVRADDCGFVAGSADTTPYLSRIADDSVVFENAVSPGPRTPSSMPLIFSGSHYRTNDGGAGTIRRLDRIEDHIRRFATISDRLSELGYTTAALTANPWTTRATGFDDQFDEFIEIGSGYSKSDAQTESSDNGFLGTVLEHGHQWAKKTDWFSQWPTFFEEVEALVRTLEEPWYLWIFLLDTHSPYIVPRKYRTDSSTVGMYYSAFRYNLDVMRGNRSDSLPPHLDERLRASYRDSIRSVDAFVGKLADEIRTEKTAFVFHSDHGEAFGEHGTYGHQERLYEENVRVPLLIQTDQDARRVSTPISLTKLPALLETIGSGSMIDVDEHVERYPIAKTEFGETVAFCGRRWKFITDGSTSELYDLEEDPRERRNLADEHTDLTDVFERYYELVANDQRDKHSIVTTAERLVDEGAV